MAFSTPPFINLGIDANTGKSYHICSHKSLLSFGAILMLLVAMCSERFLFKVMVDRMESYRYFLCQLITFMYIPPMFCIVSYKATHENLLEDDRMEFPKIHFLVMGLLDLLHGLMLYIAGGRTDPTQTLLFMQASIPILACMSATCFGVRYTRLQVIGMLVISGGLCLSLISCFEDIHSKEFDDREIGWNSLFYFFAAFPGSISMLYKERTIREQPVDISYLNAWVSTNQFVAGLLAAPLVFDAQFLHLDQLSSGFTCLIQGKSEIDTDHCYMGFPILLLYVFSNIAVNLLLLQLIRLTSVSTMSGCTLVGFLLSFVVLASYQVDPDNFGIINLHDGLRNWIPESIFVDVFAFMIIFAGKVLYQWDPDPAVEATTLSAEDKEAMSLLDGEGDYGLRYT
ncbi:putative chloroquine-resistance transporter [Plasmopara halstedii]